MLFKRKNKNATDMTVMQKILTYGLILFMVYVFLSERREKLDILDPAKNLKITNRITGEVEYLYPNQKITLSIKAKDLDALKAKPVLSEEDDISVFDIEQVSETKEEAKPAETTVEPEAEPKAEEAAKETEDKKAEDKKAE